MIDLFRIAHGTSMSWNLDIQKTLDDRIAPVRVDQMDDDQLEV